MSSKKNKAGTLVIIILLILLLFTTIAIIAYTLYIDNTEEKDHEQPVLTSVIVSELSSETVEIIPPSAKRSDWNLILLNTDTQALENELNIDKTRFDGEFIDSRIKQAYINLVNAAKADGITLYLRSGFRAISLQQSYYDTSVQRYLKAGKTQEEAEALTLKYYAYPGKSEHHTGLALDIITLEYHQEINSLDERFAETNAFAWLKKNCADYGFILRYPKDKVGITKINYEPWHYRYVGVEAAQYMTLNNLCLEEFLTKIGE